MSRNRTKIFRYTDRRSLPLDAPNLQGKQEEIYELHGTRLYEHAAMPEKDTGV